MTAFEMGILVGVISSTLAEVGVVCLFYKIRRSPPEPKTPLDAVLKLLRNPEEPWTYSDDGLYLIHPKGLAIPTQHYSPSMYLHGRTIVPWSHVPGTQESHVRDAIKLASARAVLRPRHIVTVEKKVDAGEPSNDLFSELIDGS